MYYVMFSFLINCECRKTVKMRPQFLPQYTYYSLLPLRLAKC
jgi:hypothetical protein